MSKELASPTNFMDNVREKIKNSFVELVPDETWDAMVQQEIHSFFQNQVNFKVKTEKNGGWGNSSETTHFLFDDSDLKPTMFRTMVWDMCVEATRKHLNSEYIQNIMQIALEEQKDEATGHTKSLIQDAVPLMVNKYFESIALNMTNNLADMIRANMANGAYQHP